MNDREPDDRSGWSFLGFLRSVLRDEASFRRLFALVLLLIFSLIFALALIKGDVAALYDHLTRHASLWEKWGIPPGGVGVFFGARKYFVIRRRVRVRREVEAKTAAKSLKKGKETRKRKGENGLSGSGTTAGPGPKKTSG
jgi:hypothetical protein